MTKFYDWQKIFSYQTGTTAEVVLVVGGRGIGKTYGIRKHAVKQFIKKGFRFVEVCRYREELKTVVNGYFDKFEQNREFPNHLFKTEGNKFFIADKCKESEKPEWKLCGYAVCLTSQSVLKKTTFAAVKNIIFDEVAISKDDKYHHYLPNEFSVFANLISTILREVPGEPTKAKLYLCSNSCDLLNPYFVAFGIDEPPDYGFHFYNNKSVLLHYVEPTEEDNKKRTNTLVGRLLGNSEEAETMFSNKFSNGSDEFIEDKTPNAKFRFAIAFKGFKCAIWADPGAGLYFINRKIPANHESSVWALTNKDNKLDYNMARKSEEHLKSLMDLFYLGAVRYDSPATREQFNEVLKFLGIS